MEWSKHQVAQCYLARCTANAKWKAGNGGRCVEDVIDHNDHLSGLDASVVESIQQK